MPIEQLRVGDVVLTCDFQGSCVERQVLQTFKEQSEGYLELEIAGEFIGVAYDHKFYEKNGKKWIEAHVLDRSHTLTNAKDEQLFVNGIRYIQGEFFSTILPSMRTITTLWAELVYWCTI